MKQRVSVYSVLCLFCACVLLALALTACSSGAPAERNAVTEVTLDEKGTITVKACLTPGFLAGYTEKKVYLFEVPSVYSTDVDLEELDPVAELKPRESMKAEIPAADGVRSRLYSSFLVASYDPATKKYTALTTPVAISNPQAAAKRSPSKDTAEDSIKGLISDYAADAIRLGISHTVVEVPMDKLILGGWEEGAVSYVYNGTTAYLDAEALAELDERVGVYTAAGVRVYLRFRLGKLTPETSAPAGLYLTGSSEGQTAPDSAVNMSTSFAAGIMEGFFDFMADRYADPEDGSLPVTAFLVGYRVNSAADHDGGDAPLADFITNYEKLVRVAHVAIKSHNPDGRVYVSLDSHRSNRGMAGGWDVPTFLSLFREECSLRGDYDWQISCELYADTPSVWEEDPEKNADYYTVRSLSTLTDLLTSDKFRTPEGSDRRLLISGLAIPAATAGGNSENADSANRQAASYAYAYMTCVQNSQVEALIYSAYVDSFGPSVTYPLCGLRKLNMGLSNGPILGDLNTVQLLPGEARPIYDVFKIVDTSEAPTLSTALNAVIGGSYSKLESALAGMARPVTLVKGSATLSGYEPQHKKASPLYTFDGGSLHGFESGGNLTYLELSEAETLGTVSLYARFDRRSAADPMGLTVTLPATDLIGGKEMILDLFAGLLGTEASGNRELPTVTLRLTRPAKGAISEGKGEIIYEATVSDVKGSTWQSAAFDISAFTALLDSSDEVTLTLLMDHPTADGSFNLGLAGVHVTGRTAASGSSNGLVIGLVIASVAIVAGVFTFLLWRNKRKKTP